MRDTELRDAIRAKDAAAIADQVGKILAFALQKMQQRPSASSSSSSSSPDEVNQRQAGELASMAIGVMADYARKYRSRPPTSLLSTDAAILLPAWIDISLVVTPTHLPLVFSCLSSSHHAMRLGAAELLHELVTKGMPPSDKLELIRLLNIESTIASLLDAHDQKKAAAKAANGANGNAEDEEEVVDEEDELFREKLAKVANGMGVELSKIMDEVGRYITSQFQGDVADIFNLITLLEQRNGRSERSSAGRRTVTTASCTPFPLRRLRRHCA